MLFLSILKELRARCAAAIVAERTPRRSHTPDPWRELTGKPHTERFTMKLVAGRPKFLYERFRSNCTFKPTEVAFDVPEPRVVIVDMLKFSNVDTIVGGKIDAYTWSPDRVHHKLSLPVVDCAPMTFIGEYTGLIPHGLNPGDAFEVTLSITGPSDELTVLDEPPGTTTEPAPPAPAT